MLEALETPGGEDGDRAEQLVEALSVEAQEIKSGLSDLDRAVREQDEQAIQSAVQRVEQIDDRSPTGWPRSSAPTSASTESAGVPPDGWNL